MIRTNTLGKVDTYFTIVGPIDGFGLTLSPLASITTTLTGLIIKRDGAASSDSLGILFSGFLAGENQTLSVTGNEVITPVGHFSLVMP